jgi:hypothetical protein
MQSYPAITPNVMRGRIVGGCVVTALGLAFSLSLWPIGYLGGADEAFAPAGHVGPWMIPGFALFFTGAGLLLSGRLRGGGMQAWGLGLAGFGLGVSLGLWPIGFLDDVAREFDLVAHIGPWMLAGFAPLFIGLSLVLADLALTPRDPDETGTTRGTAPLHSAEHPSALSTPVVEG